MIRLGEWLVERMSRRDERSAMNWGIGRQGGR
jgi:hypothetical protein